MPSMSRPRAVPARWCWRCRKDLLSDPCAPQPVLPAAKRIAAAPSAAQMAELRERLARAERPLLIAGGSGWSVEACADLRRFAEAWQLPVACAFRYQDSFDNEHPLYAGGRRARHQSGARQAHSARPTCCSCWARAWARRPPAAYTLLGNTEDAPVADPRPPGRRGNWAGSTCPTCRSSRACPRSRRGWPSSRRPSCCPGPGSASEAHAAYLAWRKPLPMPGEVQLGRDHAGSCCERLPHDAIVSNGSRQLRHLAASPLRAYRAFQLAARADQWRDGLTVVPAALAAKVLVSATNRGGAGRRRLLHDGRPRAGHGDAIRPEHRGDRGQQRPLRHDPHAPGTPLPETACMAPASPIPTSPPMRARSARMARPSPPPPNSRRRSNARSAAAWPALDRDPDPAGGQHAGRDVGAGARAGAARPRRNRAGRMRRPAPVDSCFEDSRIDGTSRAARR